MVILSSLGIVGSGLWFPPLLYVLWRRARRMTSKSVSWQSPSTSSTTNQFSATVPENENQTKLQYAHAWGPFLVALCSFLWLLVSPLRKSEYMQRHKFWNFWHKYFTTTVVYKSQRPEGNQFVYAMSPHGVFPYAQA